MNKTIIEVKGLYKFYKAGENIVHALDGLDFTINKGEFVAIVGPSGSGKSTLLNMLAGLEKPTKGEIIIGGTHLEKLKENQLVAFRRNNVGFIFQSYNLLPTMNALDNVALPLVFRGMDNKKRIEIAKQYLTLVGLEKQMYQNGNAMSGGQQQRVGIARALAMQPKIIFADEPTGALDSKNATILMQKLAEMNQVEETTILMVTHDSVAASFCNRILFIQDGKLFHEIRRDYPRESQEDFYHRILKVMAALAGGDGNVF